MCALVSCRLCSIHGFTGIFLFLELTFVPLARHSLTVDALFAVVISAMFCVEEVLVHKRTGQYVYGPEGDNFALSVFIFIFGHLLAAYFGSRFCNILNNIRFTP